MRALLCFCFFFLLSTICYTKNKKKEKRPSETLTKDEPAQVCKKDNSHRKNELSIAFEVCLRALESALIKVMTKHISKFFKLIPGWILKIGCWFKSTSCEEELTPEKIILIVDELKKSQNIHNFSLRPDSYIARLDTLATTEDKEAFIKNIFLQEEETISFFEDFLYFVCSCLNFKNEQELKNYYKSIYSTFN